MEGDKHAKASFTKYVTPIDSISFSYYNYDICHVTNQIRSYWAFYCESESENSGKHERKQGTEKYTYFR